MYCIVLLIPIWCQWCLLRNSMHCKVLLMFMKRWLEWWGKSKTLLNLFDNPFIYLQRNAIMADILFEFSDTFPPENVHYALILCRFSNTYSYYSDYWLLAIISRFLSKHCLIEQIYRIYYNVLFYSKFIVID